MYSPGPPDKAFGPLTYGSVKPFCQNICTRPMAFTRPRDEHATYRSPSRRLRSLSTLLVQMIAAHNVVITLFPWIARSSGVVCFIVLSTYQRHAAITMPNAR